MMLVSDPDHDSATTPSDDRSVRGIALCLALIPTLAGTARGLVVPGFRISEVLAVGLVAVMFFRYHRHLKIGGSAFWALFAYAATIATICSYHIVNSNILTSSDFKNYALGPTILLLIYVGSFVAGSLPGLIRLTVKYLLTCAAVMGLIGLGQAFGVRAALEIGTAMTGNRNIVNPIEWKVPRSVGIFNSWHAYAGYLAVCLIVVGAFMAKDVKIFKSGWSVLLVSALIAGGLLSSLTFGTIAFGFLGFSYFMIRGRKTVVLLCAGSFIYLVATFTPVSAFLDRRVALQETTTASSDGILPQTIAFRINVWLRDYIPLVEEHLLVGYGPVRSTDRVFSYFESMYIYLLVIAGVPALLTFLFAMFAIVRSVQKAGRASRSGGDALGSSVCGALVFIFTGLVVLMFIHPYLNDAGASQAFIMLSGLVIGRYLGADPESGRAAQWRFSPIERVEYNR